MTSLSKTCIIDDDMIYLFGMRILMKEIGFSEEVLEYSNAEDAMDALNRNIENGESLPSIIFLDLNMPIMDGWDFLDEFEQWPEAVRKKSKVYIISSSINPADQQRSREYDAVHGFLVKPLKEDTLKEILQSHQQIHS